MSAGDWTVWSWDERSGMWMEVAKGTKAEMKRALDRRKRAAAKHLPSAEFTMTGPGEMPQHVPGEADQ